MTNASHEVDPRLLAILVCPVTRGPLRHDRERHILISETAGLAYPIRDGVPVMLVEEAIPWPPADQVGPPAGRG